MSALATFIVACLLWPFLAMWRAYCAIILWGWFVTPHWGVQAPSIYLLVGALFVFHLLLPYRREKTEEGDPFANYIGSVVAYGVGVPAVFLGCGWAWKWLQWGVA